jgi:outer membrane protein OmpA-like peptidoglycan-associated protein/tetratricopeptide (TPR) repeat protein
MRPKIFLVFFFGFFAYMGFSQSTSKQLKKAEDSSNSLSYANTIELYDGILKNSKSLTTDEIQKAKLNLAETYYFVKDYKNAEKYYEEVLGSNPTLRGDEIRAYLRFAQVLSSNGKHHESSKVWTKYTELQEQDKRGIGFSKLYANMDPLTRNAQSYRIEYVGINTASPEFSPTFYKDGLVFVSSRPKNNSIKRVFKWDNSSFLDLYYLEDLKVIAKEENTTAVIASGGQANATAKTKNTTEKLGTDYYTPPTSNDANTIAHIGSDLINGSKGYDENSLIEIKSFSKNLNSKYHEGPCTFYDNDNKIIFTRNGSSNVGGLFGSSKKDGITRLKLYSAERKGSDWGNIKELDFNDNKYSCGHPTVNSKDNFLYFVSDMPGGYGGTDIYISRLINGTWSKPENMGSKVNSVGNEMFPFVDEAGNLYFSSDGLPGLGDLDLFIIKTDLLSGKAKGIVRNLGAPLNSSNDDFGIITDQERTIGYFSSNRKRGGSDDDIYKFKRVGAKFGCRDLVVNVFDKDNNKPIDSTVFEYGLSVTKGNMVNATTDANGTIKLCLDADKDYVFNFTKEGYVSQTRKYTNIDDSDYEPSVIEVFLKKQVIIPQSMAKVEEPKKRSELIQKRTTGGNSNIFRGVITGGEGGEPIAAVKVKFINKCTGEIQEMFTNKDGSYEFKRDLECDYELTAMKDDFGSSLEIIEKSFKKKLFGNKVKKPIITPNLFDTKLYRVGDVIKLENIYYEEKSYKIRENAKKELDKLVNTLKKYPNMIIELSSHTDTRGNAITNLQLSESRATEVFKYITSRGIDKRRVKSVGKGESEPLNACSDGVQCTEAEHQRNRRTEFKILKIEKI